MSIEEKAFKNETTVNVVSASPVDDEYGEHHEAMLGGIVKQTVRGLKPRHVQIMAMSGAIGTGLFIGTGSALSKAGPLGLFLGYSIFAVITWITFQSMGEMSSHLPIDGSFIHFAERYVSPSFAFGVGWLYTYNGATLVAAEITAVAGMVNFWNDTINNAAWCAIVLGSIFLLQIFGIHIVGEGVFWFSIWKILLIIGLLLFTFITMVGGNPQRDAFGFRYWKDPGPMAEYLTTGALGRFSGFWSVFVQAAYAYGGPDLIALAAPETIAPRRVLPRVFRRVIYRLVVFYVLGVLAVGVLVPYNDENLGKSLAGAGSSPFVLAAVRLKIKGLPSVINAAIMTSAWSCGLEVSFAASRSLYSLALTGSAPRFLRITRKGTPIFCVVVVSLVGCLCFLSVSNSSATVFNWITNITGSGLLLNAALFNFTYIRWYHARQKQFYDPTKLPYTRWYQIYLAYIGFISLVVVLLTNGFHVFVKGHWNIADFLFAYLSIAVFVVATVGHMIFRSKTFKLIPLEQVDLDTGVQEMEELDTEDVQVFYKYLPRFQRWLWG